MIILFPIIQGKPPNVLAEVTHHSVIKSIIEQCIATKEQRCNNNNNHSNVELLHVIISSYKTFIFF